MKKIIKNDSIASFCDDVLAEELEDTIGEARIRGYVNIHVVVGYNDAYSDAYSIELYGDREETDEEHRKRLNQLKKEKLTRVTQREEKIRKLQKQIDELKKMRV